MESLGTLVEADRARLVEILGATPFTIAETGNHGCQVATDRFTIQFTWHADEELLDSAFALHAVPTHAVPFSDRLHTWMVLKSRGEGWPVPQRRAPVQAQLATELERVGRAVAVLRDETTLRETLLWDAGYLDGLVR